MKCKQNTFYEDARILIEGITDNVYVVYLYDLKSGLYIPPCKIYSYKSKLKVLSKIYKEY